MDNEQTKQLIQNYLYEKKSLNTIQSLLQEEHNIILTFMELRMLSLELDMDWSILDPQKKEEEESKEDEKEPLDEVVVELNKVVPSGAMYSGNASFPSGNTATWQIDAMGQFHITFTDEENRPNEDEMLQFQQKLQQAMQR